TLAIQGAESLGLDPQGNLVLHTSGGDLEQHVPAAYQEINGLRHDVSVQYLRKGADEVGFTIGAYDPSQPLVIDPVLVYSTYLGGARGANPGGIAVDAAGNVYVAGA